MGVTVRAATVGERPAVANVLDGAALEVDHATLEARIARRDVLVAVSDDDPERVLGACVLDGNRITAIAVRRRRRNQGIGSALVTRAARERDRLVAEFDAGVRPFYAALGFDVQAIDDDRYRGSLSNEPGVE